jgi:hypothetical protein
MFGHVGDDLDIFGTELTLRFNLSKRIAFLASWSYREVWRHLQVLGHEVRQSDDTNPKNLITLGGRFRTESGLVGSLYLFSRSDFTDRSVDNPGGLLQPRLAERMDDVFLVLARIGWRFASGGVEMEAGLKLFLPVSPFNAPYFRYYEKGGGTAVDGTPYGGFELARMLTGYLRGSF